MSQQTAAEPTYRPLTHYLGRLPGHRGSARPHPSTAVRWVTRGLPLPDGTRARLRAIRIGSRWLTTDEWWAEWVEALTSAHVGGDPAASVPRNSAARRKTSDAAVAALERMGA